MERSVASARWRTASGRGGSRCLGCARAGTWCFRAGRCNGICGRCRGSRRARAAATLEVGGVPACALELKTRGCELFAEFGRTACRAVGQGFIGHLLQHILGMSAGVALVGVNGHEGSSFQVGNTKPSIIGGGRGFKPPCTKPASGQTGHLVVGAVLVADGLPPYRAQDHA